MPYKHACLSPLCTNADTPTATVAPPLDMSCDTCYRLTLMLNLESDWKRPVLVNLTNATVSSSAVIGSTSHVANVVNEQTVELTSVTQHYPRMTPSDPGEVTNHRLGDLTNVKIDFTEMTDTVSELAHDDISSDNDDIGQNKDDISGWKDDPKNDPDWDPVGDSFIAVKPACPQSPGSDCNNAGDDETKTLKCQACIFRTHAQRVLTTHVMRKHHKEASRNGLRMCSQCGKVEDSIELLQKHREVSCH